MPNINSQYGLDGVTTAVDGTAGVGGSNLSDLFRRLVEKRLAAEEQVLPHNRISLGGKSTNRAGYQRQIHTADIKRPQGPSWQSLQGAATRPTGLGPGMIPGMAVDPRLLDPRLRPSGSSFANLPGASPAALGPSRPDLPDESSNAGFDYLSPVEKARWAAAAARGAPQVRR
jgi:hypothetical protein